jgi:GAF domain-containing protein
MMDAVGDREDTGAAGTLLAGATWSAQVRKTLLAADGMPDQLQRIVDLTADVTAVDLVILIGIDQHSGQPEVLASTDYPVASRVIESQRAAGSAPAWQAILDRETVIVPDLTSDQRWSEFAALVAPSTSMTSVAAFCVVVDGEPFASLALYNKQPSSFRNAELELTTMFVEQAAAVLTAGAKQESRELSFRVAIEHAREIGAALGVMMERLHLTQDQAFRRLRKASQDQNRKLYELAAGIARTGEIPFGSVDKR